MAAMIEAGVLNYTKIYEFSVASAFEILKFERKEFEELNRQNLFKTSPSFLVTPQKDKPADNGLTKCLQLLTDICTLHKGQSEPNKKEFNKANILPL